MARLEDRISAMIVRKALIDFKSEPFVLNLDFFYDNRQFADSEAQEALYGLCEIGVFTEVKACLQSEDESLSKEMVVYSKDSICAILEELRVLDKRLPNVCHSLEYRVSFDEKAARKFIADYIKEWQEDGFYSRKGNLFNSAKQLMVVAGRINDLLVEYSGQSLLFGLDGEGEVNVIAALLFMENEGYLIIDFFDGTRPSSITEYIEMHALPQVKIRISTTDAFLKTFKDGVVDLRYCDYLVHHEKFNSRLLYSYPRTLVFNGEKHVLQRDQVPYHLLNLAYEGEGVASYEMLKEVSNEDDVKIKKSLENFKRTLRAKFSALEDEDVFTKREGDLVCDMSLFYFLPKKAKLRD